MDIEVAKLIISILSFIGAATGVSLALWQFANAQRWKKAEFAYKEIEKIFKDPIIIFINEVLDYPERVIRVPVELRKCSDSPEYLEHSYKKLDEAMPIILESLDAESLIYRDAFDYFFRYFTMIQHYVKNKMIIQEDMILVDYFIERIKEVNDENSGNLNKFIEIYYKDLNDYLLSHN